MTASVRRWGILGIASVLIAACALAWTRWDVWVVIPGKRTAVLNALRDSSSAQFKNEKLKRTGYVCGEVNAKNGMGGYTGFKRYASSETDYLLGDSLTAAPRRASTEEIMQGLDWKIDFMKSNGRVPTEDEERQAAFESRWTRVCG